MVWFSLVTDQLSDLCELHALMRDIEGISRDWTVKPEHVSFQGRDISILCRYTGSYNYDAGRTELDRMLSKRWPVVMIDDATAQSINRLDQEAGV